jgi:DNA polymerase-3 subunit beta
MKIIILKDNLIDALNSVEKSIGSGKNLQILKNIKIEGLENNQIKFISTNLELAIEHISSGKVVDKGVVIISFDILSKIVKNINSEKIQLESNKQKLTIKADNYEGVLNSEKPEEYPIIPTIQDISKSLLINSNILKKSLERALTATHYSEIRPEINGVYFCFDNNQLTLVGTDSFRLVEETLKQNETSSNFNFLKIIIPLKTVDSVLRVFGEDKEIDIFTDSNQVLFKAEDRVIISRLVDGDFPDYKSIIPKKTNEEVWVDREELINAVKLTKVFVGKANDIVFKIPKKGKVLEVYSTNDTIGENRYRVPVSIKGEQKEEMEISFNWKYVLDGLRIYKDEDVVFGITEPEKPVTIRTKKEKNIVYVVMPIRR